MLGNRIASARKRAGLSQRQLAGAMGERYDQTMISHVESGRSGLVGEGLSKAATVLGVSLDYLCGMTDDPTPADLLANGSVENQEGPVDLVRVPKVAAVVGSDAGNDAYDSTILARLPFSGEWLRERGVDPGNCHLVDVKGHLMEPSIPNGSCIFVNLGAQEFKHNGVFLLQFEQQIIERTLRYLMPVRLSLEKGVAEGTAYEDWYLSADGDKDSRWPVSLYNIKRVIGEVPTAIIRP
jgi:transcriptional regulator with XRE-family HTH domain